jgi:soluble lytic murein transglycosylase-like protein
MKAFCVSLAFIFLFIKTEAIAGNLFTELIKDEELKQLKIEIAKFKDGDFYLSESIKKFKGEEFRLSLIMLFLIDPQNSLSKVKLKDLTQLYLFSPVLSKKEFILDKIKSYVVNFKINTNNFEEKMPEVEEMVWFFLITENIKLINYLQNNNLKVQDFIEQIRDTQNFNLFKDLIYSQEDKISDLLWNNKTKDALSLILNLKNSESKNILLARVYFQTKNPKYYKIANQLINKGNFKDDGFVYDYIKYLSKTEHYREALTLLTQTSFNTEGVSANKFWDLTEALFNHYIEKKEYTMAFELMSKIKVSEDRNQRVFYRAKFLSGFVALRFLNEPNIANIYFQLLYEGKYVNAYNRSRGAYFASQSYQALNKPLEAREWLTKASKFASTFYGMRAIEELNNIEPILLLGWNGYDENHITENLQKRNEIYKTYFDELFKREEEEVEIIDKLRDNTAFKVGLLMVYFNRQNEAGDFFAVSKTKMSIPEIMQAFEILKTYFTQNDIKIKNTIINTYITKALNSGAILIDGYPVVDFVIKEDKIQPNPLIHAIIKQESKFQISAKSNIGALGLMQVMPATAKSVAKDIKLTFSTNKLKTDYKYNIKIGSSYLEMLLNKFNQSYAYSLIGYNAGPGRVALWQKRYFTPQTANEMIDFIELIPIKETKEYVFRVMESEAVYNYLLNNQSFSISIK